MSLSQTIAKIKQVKPYVDLDETKIPRETLAGHRGRQAQAIEQMKMLRSDYRRDLLESAVFIIVTGSEQNAFVETAKSGCFSASPTAFYEDIAERIPAVLYQGKESMVNLFEVVGRHLEDKMRDLGVLGYNQLIFKQEHYVSLKSKEDLVQLLKNAVNSQIGSEIVGIQAISSIVDKAINKGHADKETAIVLGTDDEKLALDLESTLRRLHPRGVSLVVAGKGTKVLRAVPNVISVKEPTEEAVKKAILQIEQKQN